MYFNIKEIVLWPRNHSLKPRRVPFESGKINVISGASRTGKSAIIPIIDYCLGAELCSIPVNTIRDNCEWFGVLIDTDQDLKLFARREPGNQRSTGDMFILSGKDIEIPDVIEKGNTSADAVKRFLDEFAGITALDFDFDNTNSGFKGRPSFRDMLAFNFQPQNVVANPNTLLYKADSYEHREKLRNIFPYVLNAVTPEILAKQHELAQLRKELQRKENELRTVQQVSERWIAEIYSRVVEARELGLVKQAISPTASRNELLEILRDLVDTAKPEAHVTLETLDESIHELVRLQNEEQKVSTEISILRKRFAEMSKLKQSTKQFKDALKIQRDRLKVSQWIGKIHEPKCGCPLCGKILDDTTEQIESLRKALEEIEKTAGNIDQVPAAFDREYERVRAEIQVVTEKFEGISIRRKALENSSEEAQRSHYHTMKVSRFLGNLEQSLKTYDRLGEDGDLEREVNNLREKVAQLTNAISEGQIKARTERALRIVTSYAEKLMPLLDTERPYDPITFSISDLTIKVKGLDREDYLWEIGSGSNWLSYHISVTLGFQQYFNELKNPVPSFVVYDQPSQVYFPQQLVVRDKPLNIDPKFQDEDIEAVRKIFVVLASVIKSSKGKSQFIVLDHAPKSIWGDIPEVHLVEEWRGNKKLIPDLWLRKS